MVFGVADTHRPGGTGKEKVSGTEIEKGDAIAQAGLHVGDEGEDVRDSYVVGAVGVNATATDTAGAFDDPEMFAKFTAIQVDAKLLCPEEEEVIEAINRLVGIAIMPT